MGQVYNQVIAGNLCFPQIVYTYAGQGDRPRGGREENQARCAPSYERLQAKYAFPASGLFDHWNAFTHFSTNDGVVLFRSLSLGKRN